MENFFACVRNVVRFLTFEQERLDFVGTTGSDKGSCRGFLPIGGGGGVKAYQSSVNMVSTKYQGREKPNIIILQKNSNVPSSGMKDATQNECKYFDIGTRVALFGLNNLEFNRKVGVIKYPIPLKRP